MVGRYLRRFECGGRLRERRRVETRTDETGAAYYVALGDSISIDDYAGGPGKGGASLLARNLDEDFPDWQGRDLGATPWLNLATDGGTTATVLGVQLPRLAGLTQKPSLVTLTIGGNDVLGCYGDTDAALWTVRTVGERVAQTLERLAEVTQPSSQVVVGTVYDPSDGTGDAGRVGLPPWPEVVEVLATLNRTLRSVAEDHGATVAEIHERFLGHGLTVGDPARADARPADRDLWYCDIIEPNAWGASAVRAAFWEALHPGAGSP
jgi:lysophospholipase L1-like esterase